MDIWGRRRHMRKSRDPATGKRLPAHANSSRSSGSSSSNSGSNSVAGNTADIPTAAAITLTVHVSNCSFPVHCGRGQQTIKWLAVSAAHRYAAETPQGRVRCREVFHSGRRPPPEDLLAAAFGETQPSLQRGGAEDAAHNFPRYPQFGMLDDKTGNVLRRMEHVGGVYQRGRLLPTRVRSPTRQTGTSDQGGEDTSPFLDALEVTYGYARMEKPADEAERYARARAEHEERLRRRRLRAATAIKDENPGSYRDAALDDFEDSWNLTREYKLRELAGDGRKKMYITTVGETAAAGVPRMSLFARISEEEREKRRPKTTLSVTRRYYGGQTSATPLRNWEGPRIQVPNTFSSPTDLMPMDGLPEPMGYGAEAVNAAASAAASTIPHRQCAPDDVIADHFQDGDHVWIDLALDSGQADSSPVSVFLSRAFRRARAHARHKVVDEVVVDASPSEVTEEEVVEARRLLVTRRSMRDNEHDEKSRRQLRKLLQENLSKSKVHRIITDEVELTQCEKFIFEHYLVLENTFRHFSFMAPGDNFSLSANEWASLCSACNILTTPPKLDAATASRVFIASNVNLSARSGKATGKPEPFDEDNPKNALIMYEFLEALVRLALEKFRDQHNLRPSQKLKRLLDENVLPVGREITESWEKTLHEVETDAVQDALEHDLNGLKFAFVFYAHKRPKKILGRVGRDSSYLTMDEWIHCLEESSVLRVAQGTGGGGSISNRPGSPSRRARSNSSTSFVSSKSGMSRPNARNGSGVLPPVPGAAGAAAGAAEGAGGSSSSGGARDDGQGGRLTMQRAQECFVAANSHSERLRRKNTAAAEERSFRQMEFPEFLEALVHVASRLDTTVSLADNIYAVANLLRTAVSLHSQDVEYQRATMMMDKANWGDF